MNSSSAQLVDCRVIGGEKLPASAGGPTALCDAVARAAAAATPARKFTVEIRVLGSSALTATLTTAEGETLPEQKFASSDRDLTSSSLDRFANALIGAVARAASR